MAVINGVNQGNQANQGGAVSTSTKPNNATPSSPDFAGQAGAMLDFIYGMFSQPETAPQPQANNGRNYTDAEIARIRAEGHTAGKAEVDADGKVKAKAAEPAKADEAPVAPASVAPVPAEAQCYGTTVDPAVAMASRIEAYAAAPNAMDAVVAQHEAPRPTGYAGTAGFGSKLGDS